MKHALAGEHTGGADAIESAHEFVAIPHLDAVRVAEAVHLDVGGGHRGQNPRAALAGARGRGTRANHPLKGAIDREAQVGESALRFAEIVRHVQLGELQNRPLRRADPGNWVMGAAVGPRKNPVPVGGDDARGREVEIERDKPEVIVGIGSGPFRCAHA